MNARVWLVFLCLFVGLDPATRGLAAARAADAGCLSAEAIQEALVSGRALRLADVRHKLKGDIVRADLCRNNGKLAYFVTILTPDGMVRRVAVDASSGELVYGRP